MKDSRQSAKQVQVENISDEETSKETQEVSIPGKQGVDMTVLKNNPKIDTRLFSEFLRLSEEYESLAAPLKDVPLVTQGADYNLAHPLARKDMPTDAYHLGKSQSKVQSKRTEHK